MWLLLRIQPVSFANATSALSCQASSPGQPLPSSYHHCSHLSSLSPRRFPVFPHLITMFPCLQQSPCSCPIGQLCIFQLPWPHLCLMSPFLGTCILVACFCYCLSLLGLTPAMYSHFRPRVNDSSLTLNPLQSGCEFFLASTPSCPLASVGANICPHNNRLGFIRKDGIPA